LKSFGARTLAFALLSGLNLGAFILPWSADSIFPPAVQPIMDGLFVASSFVYAYLAYVKYSKNKERT